MNKFINYIIFIYNHIRLFYYKWIRRRCRHFCLFCSHKYWCIKDVGILQVINEFKKEVKEIKNESISSV